MISLASLWLPILLSAVIVFLASSVLHMVLTYHRKDFDRVPAEDEVMASLAKVGITPGEYVMPYASTASEMKDPAYQEKVKRGPVAFFTVMPSGVPNMGPQLAQWFVYCLVVSIFAAYIAGRAEGPAATYYSVFRFASVTAFAGYALALWQNTIWYKRKPGTTMRHTFDALIYALLTGGTFAGLWPG
jgi:hypothetical protein